MSSPLEPGRGVYIDAPGINPNHGRQGVVTQSDEVTCTVLLEGDTEPWLFAASAVKPIPAGHVLTFADLTLVTVTGRFTRAGRVGRLTRTENALLQLLMRHPGQILTRQQILREVWGFDFRPKSDSLDVYVSYVRRKTEAGGEVRLLHTVRGQGYLLREPR